MKEEIQKYSEKFGLDYEDAWMWECGCNFRLLIAKGLAKERLRKSEEETHGEEDE